MRTRAWEVLATVVFLGVCLLVGLALAELYAPEPIIGVARFEGVIESASAQQMALILEAAGQDARVAGVVMEVNSVGGDASSSEKLYHAMMQLRQRKPLVVSIDGSATSGGYYMAVAGDKVYAPASAEVGHVGVWTLRPFDPEIVPGLISTGPYKLSDRGGARFDRVRRMELVKEAFLSTVVHRRDRSPYNSLKIDARALAEARIYLGSEALAIGLIDAQGSLSDAILAAVELAGVDKYRVVDLADYLDMPSAPGSDVWTLIDDALPGTVLLLDSRVLQTEDVRKRLISDSFYLPRNEHHLRVPNQ
jgi:protease-4